MVGLPRAGDCGPYVGQNPAPARAASVPCLSQPRLCSPTVEAALPSLRHLLYVNQLANRSVSIDVDITTNRHLGT